MLRRRVAGPRPAHPALSLFLFPVSRNDANHGSSVTTCVAGVHVANFTCGGKISGLFTSTPTLLYMYKPPGTSSNETSRLPWYHRSSPSTSTTHSTTVAAAAAAAAAAASNEEVMRAPSQAPSPLQKQNIPSLMQSVSAAGATPSAGIAAAAPATSSTSSAGFFSQRSSYAPSVTDGAANTRLVSPPPSSPASGAPSTPTAATTSSPSAAATAAAAFPAPTNAASSAAAAPLRRWDSGALRPTPARRMSAMAGPTLDARVEDIVKVEETLASELTLPKVVQLLIDPNAEAVERITMSEFAAMQPKRRLVALNGKKEWLQWIEQSTYYQQAARLSAESPAQDLAALQQAGIQSLQQWLEHPQLVKVSARTRSALDTAVAQSVEAYMSEVVEVVNTSNAVEEVLTHWVSDVMGKFILDSLQVPLDRASQAMWTSRKEWMPADVVRNGTSCSGGLSRSASASPSSSSANRGVDVTGGGAPQSVESRMLSEMMMSSSSSNVAGAASSSAPQQQPMLRPGEACTLDHYLRFVKKVMSSVRQDYVANHAAMGHGTGGRGDAQAEQEITARSHGVIAAAFTQLLEQAVLHQLPPELTTLQQSGYLALDRVPGLLRRAGDLLQLRAVPVRFFVFHSSVDAAAAAAAAAAARGGNANSSSSSSNNSNGARMDASAGLSLQAPPYYPAGTFLTGSSQMDVTLGEWSGRPDPPSSTARESGGVVDDATEQEYLSVLHRLRRRVDTLAVTSLFEVIAQPERYGGSGFSAVEAVGLQQLFGPVKLLEDRLTTALHYPIAATNKPIHFVEAGPLSGKTALLEQLAERTARPGDKVVLVRYSGCATPYLPDLDDHPVAFAARFWFRVALASCPYLIRTEELYSRAPRSVYWWGHEKNWSWERYQSLLQSARNAGAGHRQHQQQQRRSVVAAATTAPPAQLASILVDDVDRALSAMQLKWGDAAALSAATTTAARTSQAAALVSGGAGGGGGGGTMSGAGLAGQVALTAAAAQRAQQAENDRDEEEEGAEDAEGGDNGHRGTAHSVAAPSLEQQRQLVISLWLSTGKSVEEHLSSCFTQLSAAVGQVNLVFTGAAVSPLLLTHCAAPCRRYYLPLSGGVGLQSRLRVLPLLATLHALHLTHHLDMPGLLYEVLKNCPALAGKALELFWSHRVTTMDLRTGLPRLAMGSGSAHPQLMQSYVPRELFAELPLYATLLLNPRRTRRRLVELLQRQLSSPTGYLSTELDTTPQDVKDGLVLPHNLTSSQVHPFALFAIFSRQDAIDERVYNSEGQLLDGSEAAAAAADGIDEMADSQDDGEVDAAAAGAGEGQGKKNSERASRSSDAAATAAIAAAAARVRSSTGVGSNERKVVRAWAEVWAEYRSVVSSMSTSPTRKRDAMRVLLHGALLLRSAAVAGAQLELNLKVPSYGFPLLASETRVRSSSVSAHPQQQQQQQQHPHQRGDSLIRPATPQTVRRATAAYKMFFSNAAPSHFPFRPMVGLNGGCDVVFVCGSTLALYDIVTTTEQLWRMVGRFAEALLGVLHVLERQVLPVDKVRAVQFVTVVSLDEARPGAASDLSSSSAGGSSMGGVGYCYHRGGGSGDAGGGGASAAAAASSSSLASRTAHAMSAGGLSVDVFNMNATAPNVPYYLDYSAIFEDHVMDRLRALQQALGITKDFRTLNELIDEIERTHRVRVMQDVVSTPEEVESLFSPTLLQLVPDATVLPAYTSAVVSATELMMLAMKGGSGNGSGGGSSSSSGGGGGGAAAALAGASAARRAGDDGINLSIDDDDDDDADYVNLGEEEVAPGAELDDVASDVRLARSASGRGDPLMADHEYLHESAELLEAMMNDNLDLMSNSSARLREQREETARDLRRDLVMEDRINYNAPPPTAEAPQQQSQKHGTAGAAGRSVAEDAEADALAWLHDIITPESLIAGLRGTAPGVGTPVTGTVSSAQSSPVSTLQSPGGVGSPIQGLFTQAQQQSSPLAAVAAAGAATPAAGAMPMVDLHNVKGPWTPNMPQSPGGTENIAAVFPRTAAKRDDGASSNSVNPAEDVAGGAAAAAAESQAGGYVEENEDGPVSSERGTAAKGGEGAAADDGEEELDLQKLFDEVGSRRKRGKTAPSCHQRRGSRIAAGRRSEEAKRKKGTTPATTGGGGGSSGREKSKSPSNSTKGRKSSGSRLASSANRKKAKASSSSGGKKKSSSAKKK